jgi:hypothetical protein
MRRTWLLLFVTLVSAPRAAWSQAGDALGPEFRVNTYTTNYQSRSAVASDSSGNFVVVWHSLLQDGSGHGIFGQRYANSGIPLGPEFRVNTYTPGAQIAPSVAADSSGNFVAVWHSNQDASFGVFGRRYASSGAPLGPEFRVNTYTTSFQGYQSVAADSSGNFVVVWESQAQDGSAFGVFGQRYANSGIPLGPEFRVNTYTTGGQYDPSVASDSSGNFVVVWRSQNQDGSNYGIFAQRYASAGAPLGPEFRVNTYTTSSQRDPAVALNTAGNFMVIWNSFGQDGSAGGIFGQRYASAGAPLGPEFRVNTYTTNEQLVPSVATDFSGNFVIVWQSSAQDGSSDGIFGQRYAGSGTPVGPEFRINTYTTTTQRFPSVAADTAGNFVVAWESYTQDGSDLGVFGQRYSQIVPIELMYFGVE